MNEPTPAVELTPPERRALRARAHALEPVVRMGDKGLTPSVLAEIDRALAAHELLKIRVQAGREDRAALLAEICGRTGASAVQHIGKMLVVYRKKPHEEDKPEDRTKVRKDAARKARSREKAQDTPGRKPARKPGSRTGIKFRARSESRSATRSESRSESGTKLRPARGTGRPGSRTASPRREPAHPPRRRRTSR